MMKRDECFRVLARQLGDEIVLPVYSSAFDWLEIAPRALNYYSFGAMGLGSSCALGFALGHPGPARDRARRRRQPADEPRHAGDHRRRRAEESRSFRRAATAPMRRTAVIRSRSRTSTSPAWRRRPATRTALDFSGACDDFEAALPRLLKQDGPIFAALHIEKGALSPEFNYRKLDDPKMRDDFRAALPRDRATASSACWRSGIASR